MAFDTPLARRAARERRHRWEERRLRTLERVTTALRRYFEPRPVERVYVTGSLTRQDAFRPGSDIDVAVEGLPPERYLTTLAALQDLLETDHVNLIELERCRFRSKIERHGTRVL